MGLRIIDRKDRTSRQGAKADPNYRELHASETERLFGSPAAGFNQYKTTFAEKAEKVQQGLVRRQRSRCPDVSCGQAD